MMPTTLIVDDEISVLNLLKRILDDEGHTTITARSGEEALEIFESCGKTIDLVILDISMPGIGGLETCRKLNGLTKIILITGNNADELETEFGDISGILQKPFNVVKLNTVVGEVLGKR